LLPWSEEQLVQEGRPFAAEVHTPTEEFRLLTVHADDLLYIITTPPVEHVWSVVAIFMIAVITSMLLQRG
jgi:hypothetical protein